LGQNQRLNWVGSSRTTPQPQQPTLTSPTKSQTEEGVATLEVLLETLGAVCQAASNNRKEKSWRVAVDTQQQCVKRLAAKSDFWPAKKAMVSPL
jgi:hypothetical protein